MKAFNIHIIHKNERITLTIIPHNDYFKIVYFEGIIGAVKKAGSKWNLMPEEAIEPGEFAPYDYKLTTDGGKIVLGPSEVNQIAEQIENQLN